MQGKLIVFEGTDGSGKATQSELLCQELTRRGVPYRKLTFPRYQEESSALVRLYLGGAFGQKPGDTFIVPSEMRPIGQFMDKHIQRTSCVDCSIDSTQAQL